MIITSVQTWRELKSHMKKAMGSDGVSSKVMKTCPDQLCRMLQNIYNMSLRLERVPRLWKAISSTGAPQGIVLAPFLFTFYIIHFRYNSETYHLR